MPKPEDTGTHPIEVDAPAEAPLLKKPHYFEVVMNSTSDVPDDALDNFPGGVYLNQEIRIREYSFTAAELTVKQMHLSRDVIPAILASFDTMSMPLQEEGLNQMAAAFEAMQAKFPVEGSATAAVPPGQRDK